MTPDFPTGIVTLAFTDIEGSSDLWELHRAGFQSALDAHNRLIREAAARWNGVEVKTAGDSFMFVFNKPSDAVQWAVEAELALMKHAWPADIGPLRVRIGMHSGEPQLGQHPNGLWDYFGAPVNRAARVEAAGHGGQILTSNSTHDLALPELPAAITFIDLGVHRLKGVGEEQLWQVRHGELPTDFPPVRTLNLQRHNLPQPPTAFVGRGQETESWCDLLLRPATRLLTLTGFGGMGKTRAALQLAELCVEQFADGVWWIELEEARSDDEIFQRIAHVLRLALQPQPGVRQQVLDYLAERQTLLALDNVEQIDNAADAVSQLLRAAPQLKCLVTSRRALTLQAEQLVEVPPLPATDAETLFVERARAHKSDFAVTAEYRAEVAELCRRLEGVPLAIELAASRIRMMTPRDMLAHLDERFRLLQTRAPDLPARQRTLRGAIDWSYELLSDDERSLFCQVAVFAGGFSLWDAEAICSAGPDVFEGIEQLINHSLLRQQADTATQPTRYLMLESLREYALEKWSAGDREQWNALRRRHAEHFLQFAEQQASEERKPGEAAALEAMERELDNVRAALLWSADAPHEAGAADMCARLALALYWLLQLRGFWQAALQFTQMALEATQRLPSTTVQHVYLLWQRGSLLSDLGDFSTARDCAAQSLAAFRELRNDSGVAQALNLLGLIARREKKWEESRSHFEESLRMRRALHEETRIAMCLNNLGTNAQDLGDFADAQACFEEALALMRDAGDERGIGGLENNLGVLAFYRHDLNEARQRYTNALRVVHKLSDRYQIASCLHNLGEVAEQQGDLDRAQQCFSAALQLYNEIHSPMHSYSAEALQRIERAQLPINPAEVISVALQP